MKKIRIHILIITLISLILLSSITVSANVQKSTYIHGTVIEILNDNIDEENFIRTQLITVKITERNYNNKIITMEHVANLTSLHHIILSPNDKIIIWTSLDDTTFSNCRVYSYAKDHYLLYLLIAFILLIILIGGLKGVSSIISLAITIALLFLIFFPLILRGYNPILAAFFVCFISTCITLIFIGNFTPKTYAAIFGTLGGLVITVLLIISFGSLSHIRGLSDNSVQLLAFMPKNLNLDFKELLYAGIVIGALGAIMDVAMSISSSMFEICEANPRISNSQLFLAGMRIGKDIMGTMSNTLVLAYVGSSINLILIFFLYELTLTQFINGDQIAAEILRALSGSIGLVISIPLTSVSFLFFRESHYR